MLDLLGNMFADNFDKAFRIGNIFGIIMYVMLAIGALIIILTIIMTIVRSKKNGQNKSHIDMTYNSAVNDKSKENLENKKDEEQKFIVCPYCNTKSKANSTKCSSCGAKFK